jgi:hypothetical protein
MAKSKLSINDIQKALLANTKYIKESDRIKKPIEEKEEPKAIVNNQVNIDQITLKKFKILAPFLGESVDDLVNKALNHFLRLKSLQLDQAIQKLTEED